jgi:hypothetical protein
MNERLLSTQLLVGQNKAKGAVLNAVEKNK